MEDATCYDLESKSAILSRLLTHYEDDVTSLDYMVHLGKSEYAVPTFDFYVVVRHDLSAQAKLNFWTVNIQ